MSRSVRQEGSEDSLDHTQPQSKSKSRRKKNRSLGDSLAWIFRANLPPKRGAPLQDVRKRDWFGFGEALTVLANPNDTLAELSETRKALEKALRELRFLTTSLPPQAFPVSSLPLPTAAIHPRPSEASALHRLFDGPPIFTVLCGPPSVGKTTLLREVLKDDKYYVLYFDMKIVGGAKLEGLFGGLCAAVEWFVQSMLNDLKQEGKENEELEKIARAIKHGSQTLSRQLDKSHSHSKSPSKDYPDKTTQSDGITTTDIARLIQLFRTALLLSWQLRPTPSQSVGALHHHKQQSSDGDITSSEETKVGLGHAQSANRSEHGKEKSTETNEKEAGPSTSRITTEKNATQSTVKIEEKPKPAPAPTKKRIPILVFDDAHKLPSLVSCQSQSQILHYLLEGLVVLSKQDRLCHVVHTTSDGLYVNWLREVGALEACKIITLSDPAKPQLRTYLTQTLLPSLSLSPDPSHSSSVPHSLPPLLRCRLESEDIFNRLYEALGGRLVHWADFVGDWINAGGDLPIERSNPFLHAYTQLNVLLLRASEADAEDELDALHEQETLDQHQHHHDHDHDHDQNRNHGRRSRTQLRSAVGDRCRSRCQSRSRSRIRAGGAGACLPGPGRLRRGMKSSATLLALGTEETYVERERDRDRDRAGGGVGGEEERPPLTTMQLLDVLYRLTSPSSAFTPTIRPISMKSVKALEHSQNQSEGRGGSGPGGARNDMGIPYFALCRELGSTRAVDFLIRSRIVELRWSTPLPSSSSSDPLPSSVPDIHRRGKQRQEPLFVGETLATAEVDVEEVEEDDNISISPADEHETQAQLPLQIGVYGPTLHPTSTIMSYAMRVVLDEYGYEPPQDDACDDDVLDDVEDDRGDGAGGGMYYGHGGNGGHGRGGRESSGLSDDKSDYVSLEDVSEY